MNSAILFALVVLMVIAAASAQYIGYGGLYGRGVGYGYGVPAYGGYYGGYGNGLYGRGLVYG